MGLIDFVLNVAGLLLWLNWRSLRLDPLARTSAATLAGTLKRAGPHRRPGWLALAALGAVLGLRAVLYWEIGSPAGWTPKLDLGVVALAFRNDVFSAVFCYSLLSFARLLLGCYFWLLLLALVNRGVAQPDPILKALRLHLGWVARWPWPFQLLLPLLVATAAWVALHPALLALDVVSRVRTWGALATQGLLVSLGLIVTLKYLFPVFLFLHLIGSYVYLGANPLWDFVTTTARHLLAPLQWLPLRLARFDFAPLAGVVLVFGLLHWLPNYILAELARRHLVLWPQ